MKTVRLLSLLFVALATARLPTNVSLPAFTATTSGSFVVTNSPRFHNRPLYGAHNSNLVLAGDRPIFHLADDSTLFGGFMLGVTVGDVGVWSHEAEQTLSEFVPGTFVWTMSDARLPGLSIVARVLPLATGLGAVFDVNVTATQPLADAVTLVWAFGCGTTPNSPNPLGWYFDPLVNPVNALNWTFSPTDCAHNTVNVLNDTSLELTLGSGAAHVVVDLVSNSSTSTIGVGNASVWSSVTALVNSTTSNATSPVLNVLPVPGAMLWLRASTLSLSDGALVSSWLDGSGGGFNVTQINATLQPKFAANAFGSSVGGVVFDGLQTLLTNADAAVGTSSTMFAVFRDDGSSGGSTGACCSGVVFFTNSFNGIATLPVSTADDDDASGSKATPIVTKLDYAGSPANGHTDIIGRLVVAASMYTTEGPSTFWVGNCKQGSASIGGSAGAGVMIGSRNNELGRFFKGAIGEVVVFPRALSQSELSSMHAYFNAAWPMMPPRTCDETYPLGVGQGIVALPSTPATPTTTRFTWSIAVQDTHSDPAAQLAAADARVAALTRVSVSTPLPLINAAASAMGPAIDGLFRDNPGIFVHGAMAWDVPYVGWRSEYGGTVYGRPELVAQEGRFFFNQQTLVSQSPTCQSDPTKLLTQEAPTSRFYGRGHIAPFSGMYDMQSQMFDQQIHMWRWTGNETHASLLRPALALHAEWAGDCFDGDANGLYQSYINTWPTDSVWYNGGETAEETAYMLRTHAALRDLATLAGNATDAALHASIVARITSAFPSLWVTEEGHPAAFREEGGHQRLRPDAWLYSIFLPIEASLLSPAQAAQALFYTEWGLERDAILPCDDGSTNCGEVVWTSNWVPSMWSVRQLWSGDNYALAQAYFTTGLPDDGFIVLEGNLRRDMLLSGVPGQAGGANGGTDFNDCVHPLSRALVEGLFGFHPDRPSGTITIAPQFPSSWPNASLSTPDIALSYAIDSGGAYLNVTLALATPTVIVKLPLRAQSVGAVNVVGLPAGATWNYSVAAGFGQSVITICVQSSDNAPISDLRVSSASAGAAIAYTPSVAVNASAGQDQVQLRPPAPLVVVNFSDPQGVFVPASAVIVDGTLFGNVSATASVGHYLVLATVSSGLGLYQILQFKLAVSPPPSRDTFAPVTHSPTSSWAYAPVASMYNADMSHMFDAGTYVSPRPQTCAVRIGTDGWSAWTFPWWGSPKPPVPDFSNLPALSIGGGAIMTPQGAQFLLNVSTGSPNIAFASLWDNYAPVVNVSVPTNLLPNASTVWILLAGSTNPMQTRLANAVLRFRYADGTIEAMDLVPPTNFWALSSWGNNDYDYATDAFCLPASPPPTVQLGNNNRAMVYTHALSGALVGVDLEVLSQEVVIGLLSVSLLA